MKLIQYTDSDGFLQQSLLPDQMSAQRAEQGIPQNPPDVRLLDCDLILKELNELLIKRGLLTLADINKQDTLSNAILLVIKPKIIDLYKDHPTGLRSNDPPISENN